MSVALLQVSHRYGLTFEGKTLLSYYNTQQFYSDTLEVCNY